MAIELRAIAGALYPLVDPTKTFIPDGCVQAAVRHHRRHPLPDTVKYLDTFPYLFHPVSGYDVVPLLDSAS